MHIRHAGKSLLKMASVLIIFINFKFDKYLFKFYQGYKYKLRIFFFKKHVKIGRELRVYYSNYASLLVIRFSHLLGNLRIPR